MTAQPLQKSPTGTAVAQPARPASVLIDMSTRFGMEPAAFEATLRATVVPKESSKEQFAAFLLVARDYGLNPITKEIFAFPTRGGGIQPIVSIDGWMSIINRQPSMDGLEFEDHLTDGALTAITCKIFRKDRSHPIEVTEYMSECKRETETWKKWPARMLRHKAAIQCARYAFGISGLQDPDEYERMERIGETVPPRPTRESVRQPEAKVTEVPADTKPEPESESAVPASDAAPGDSQALLEILLEDLTVCQNSEAIDDVLQMREEEIDSLRGDPKLRWEKALEQRRAAIAKVKK